MPQLLERVPNSDSTKKSQAIGRTELVRIHHSPRPELLISQKWGPRSFFLPSKYEESIEEIDNFKVRPEDVWIVGFPKSGTTWTQELVWQICNNLDFEKGKLLKLPERSPFFEQGTIFPDSANNTQWLAKLSAMSSQRIIKTHLPAPFLPKGIWTVKPKIVYIARNIKDTAVSFYHFYNLFGYRGSFDEYMEEFLKDTVLFSPIDAHVNDFWNMRTESNILFLTYEEMKKDLPGVIKKTTKFLGKFYTDDQVKALEDHLSFNKMANNGSVNMENLEKYANGFKFMRKGKVGSFREEMTPELIERFDAQIRKRHEQYKADHELLDIYLA